MRSSLLVLRGSLACFFFSSFTALAQTAAPSAATAFSKARGMYYTPVDQGLQGFHCDVNFDWKSFLEKATNQAIPDTDERLAYLRGVKLSVDDDLHGTGELHWTAPNPAPEGSEDSIAKIRNGMQQMWAGFFQTWNGFYTGEILSVTDSKTTVERTPAGFHLVSRDGQGLAEEQFDNQLGMQSLHVATPTLDSVMTPTFTDSPQGRVVSVIRSVYKQPPTAAGAQVDMKLNYTTVGGFQIPSELMVEVAGTASFDYHLSGCTVKTQLTTK